MADRDKIPSSIPRRWKSLYKQVCEMQSPEGIAGSALRPLRKDVKEFGNEPVHLINDVANRIRIVADDSLFSTVDNWNWDEEHNYVDRMEEETTGDLDGLQWAAMACHQTLNRLEAGEHFQDVGGEMYKQYFLNIFNARFAESIPYTKRHHADAKQEAIEGQINLVRPHLMQKIEPLKEQLAKYKNVKSLRFSRKDKQPVDIHAGDILQGIIA